MRNHKRYSCENSRICWIIKDYKRLLKEWHNSHNPKVGGSNPPSATKEESRKRDACGSFCFCVLM